MSTFQLRTFKCEHAKVSLGQNAPHAKGFKINLQDGTLQTLLTLVWVIGAMAHFLLTGHDLSEQSHQIFGGSPT